MKPIEGRVIAPTTRGFRVHVTSRSRDWARSAKDGRNSGGSPANPYSARKITSLGNHGNHGIRDNHARRRLLLVLATAVPGLARRGEGRRWVFGRAREEPELRAGVHGPHGARGGRRRHVQLRCPLARGPA